MTNGISGGRGSIRDALPVREVVGKLILRYQRKIEYNIISTAFNEMRFNKKYLLQKYYQRNAFNKMQEKPDGEKASKTRLLIISVERIARSHLLDISVD